jgi:hypothetical protein
VFEFYGHEERRIVAAQKGRRLRYKHFFGGEAAEYGFQFEPEDVPLHIISVFDTKDPLWPIPTDLPRFPVCYGFHYNGAPAAYRVEGSVIRVLRPRNPEYEPDFPYTDYPEYYPQHRLTLQRERYNPRSADDVLANSATFGLVHVPERTLKRVAAELDESSLYWEGVRLGELTREEYLRKNPSSEPLFQGVPNSKCVYRKCSAFGKKAAMKIVGLHFEWNPNWVRVMGGEPEYEFLLWAEDIDEMGETVQLIFQMCFACGTMYVSNQCQ